MTEGYYPLGLIYKPLDGRDILTRIELRFGRSAGTAVQQRHLTINYRGRKLRVPYVDVTFVEADGKYCCLYTVSAARLPVLQSLQSMLDQLAPLRIIQVHRSYLINPAKVAQLYLR